MTSSLEDELAQLARSLGQDPRVRAIGLAGGDRPLPAPGHGDLDLFVYAAQVPPAQERRELLRGCAGVRIEVSSGGPWGVADTLDLGGVETWLMYFTVVEAQRELDEILSGKFLDRLDAEYYPVGRAAMFRHMRPLYDADGVIAAFKARVAVYPETLAGQMLAYHLGALEDTEDLDRAVQMGDVLFYHYALDRALDHFLLALFALNRAFFPSRKRSREYVDRFHRKPDKCAERLLEIVKLGGQVETLGESREKWRQLVTEIALL